MASLEPLPFALAACGCPPHAELELSMAAALGDVDTDALDTALERVAAAIVIPQSPEPRAELAAVAELWDGEAMPRCAEAEWPVGLEDVLLHSALREGAGHPLTQALVAVEAGRRCGFALGVVSNGTDHCVAHTRLPEPEVVQVPSGELIDGRSLPPVLTWRCAHETCALLLDEIEERLLRGGDVTRALEAAELRMHLPVDESGQERAMQQRAGVLARLN